MDSQLELVLGADCWEVDPAVLALLGGCELRFFDTMIVASSDKEWL